MAVVVKNYCYDVISADLDYKVHKHPQQDMRDLGFIIKKSEPCQLADCWWFRVEKEPDNIPGYITEMSHGFKFSDER